MIPQTIRKKQFIEYINKLPKEEQKRILEEVDEYEFEVDEMIAEADSY